LLEDKTAAAAREKAVTPVLPIVAGLVLLLGGVGFYFMNRQAEVSQRPPVLTGDARAYVHNLKLSEVEMKANESYLKQSVVEITGKIGNEGDRALRLVEITCIFSDPSGLVVLRERAPIVSQKVGGLAPAEIKNFRLAFDNIPESWNQAMPQLVIAQIVFAQ
jgi:hypothetical protein